MSTGQRQRVKFSTAIAADPQLVFLDEPTDGLDPLARDEVLTLIRQVSEEYGIHVMISSHLLEEVEQICDNIVILNAGKLVAAGQLDKLTGESTGLEIELIAIDDYPNSIEDVQWLCKTQVSKFSTNQTAQFCESLTVHLNYSQISYETQ